MILIDKTETNLISGGAGCQCIDYSKPTESPDRLVNVDYQTASNRGQCYAACRTRYEIGIITSGARVGGGQTQFIFDDVRHTMY